MTCERVTLAGGGAAIVCGPTNRCRCGSRATILCDWKVPGKRSGTCDAPLCARCTTSPAPSKDLCAKHATAFASWSASRTHPVSSTQQGGRP